MGDRYARVAPWIGLAALLAVGVGHWRLIEVPQMGILWLLVLVAIAVAPSAATVYFGRWAGLATLAVSVVLAFGITSGLWPGSSGHHRYPAAVWKRIDHGAHDWFNATTPFDVGRFSAVDSDARLLLMLLIAVIAYTVLVRRWALISIGISLGLFAFPATVVNLERPWLSATLFLIAALIALRTIPRHSAQRSAGWGQAWALGAAVVVLGLTVSALPGVAKGAFLGWHTWNPLAADTQPRSLAYVWNQTYAPLHWHGQPTPVLQVWSKHPMYWRVASDETWTGTAWKESSTPLQVSGGLGQGPVHVPPENLPSKALTAHGDSVASIRVQVLALADQHLVSAGQTLSWTAPQAPPFTLQTDGSAIADVDPDRGLQYSSRVYTPDLTPAQLSKARGPLPAEVRQHDLTFGGLEMPRWPASTALAASRAVSPDFVRASNQVWQRSGAADAPNQWAAAAKVEQYFRHAPFSYDLTPRYSAGSPVLAQFMLSVHKGYCQMFSGSMALVLRLHGIPSRVAVGFTPGFRTSINDPYVVTDRDAHSWVEVYFPHYGWQPFDPTPTRHLPEVGSTSSFAYKNYQTSPAGKSELPSILGTNGQGGPSNVNSGKGTLVNPHGHRGDPGARLGRGGAPVPVTAAPHHGHGFLATALALVALVVVLIGAVKFAAVRWRYLRPGPRARASAAYRELSTFVGDQGVEDSPERTFEDLSVEINRVFGVDASEFARHASRARYAPPAQAAEAGSELRGDMRSLKRQIRARLTWRDRVGGALRMRSAIAQITSLD